MATLRLMAVIALECLTHPRGASVFSRDADGRITITRPELDAVQRGMR